MVDILSNSRKRLRREFLHQITTLMGMSFFSINKSFSTIQTIDSDQPVYFESAYTFSRKLKTKQISSYELTKAIFDRINKYNPTINAIVTFNQEEAFKQAKLADRELLFWIGFATLAGLPATVAPVGLTSTGLPVGIQIIGPYLEDATSINIAGLLENVVGGFVQAPNFY